MRVPPFWRASISRLIATALITVGAAATLAWAGDPTATAAEPVSSTPDRIGGTAADSLSIADCMRIAGDQSPEVRIAALTHVAASFDSAGAARNRRPRIGLTGSALVAPPGFYDPAVTNLGEYQVRLGLSVPLRDGGRAARERERASEEAHRAGVGLDRTRLAAIQRAAELGVEILLLREKMVAQTASLDWLDDLGRLLESRVSGGTAPPSDRIRVDLERDAVRVALAANDTDGRLASRELGRIMGRPPGAEPLLRSPGPDERFAPVPADSIRLVTGVARLPEVRDAVVAGALARIDQADAEHRRSLQVNLTADAGLAGTDLAHVVPPDVKADNARAGFADRLRRDLGASATVEASLPLVDASIVPAAEARRAASRAAQLQVEAQTDAGLRGTLDLLDRWRGAALNLRGEEDLAQRADVNLLRVKSLYAAGATGILDLLDARRILDNAREQLVEARARCRAARLEAETRP